MKQNAGGRAQGEADREDASVGKLRNKQDQLEHNRHSSAK